VEEWRDVLVPVVCAVCSSVAVTVKKKKEAILFLLTRSTVQYGEEHSSRY
jgi:hypothetical protein